MIAKQRKTFRTPVNSTWVKKQGGLLDACLRALRLKKPALAADTRKPHHGEAQGNGQSTETDAPKRPRNDES